MQGAPNTGRLAGALYFLSAVAAGIPLIYVPGTLIISGDAAATSHTVQLHEAAFRACMAGELLGALLLVATVRTLHGLLHTAHERLAWLMVTFVLLSVPITFANIIPELAALQLFHGATTVSAIAPSERNALAMLCLDLHAEGASVANIFWGLWLAPFGLLIVKSRALPRLLGVWLIADAGALVAVSLTNLFIPSWIDTVSEIAIPGELAELAAMAWLLVTGAKTKS
jgi:hypothetical protein